MNAQTRGGRVRPIRYPAQLVVTCTQETYDRVERDSLRDAMSKSEVTRPALEAGLELTQLAHDYDVELVELVNAARLYAAREAGESTTLIASSE